MWYNVRKGLAWIAYGWSIREERADLWMILCSAIPTLIWFYTIFTSPVQTNSVLIGYAILYGAFGLGAYNAGIVFINEPWKNDKKDWREWEEKWKKEAEGKVGQGKKMV